MNLILALQKELGSVRGLPEDMQYVRNAMIILSEAHKTEAAQQSGQGDGLPCGHDLNNLRLGDDGIYGCAECLATRR